VAWFRSETIIYQSFALAIGKRETVRTALILILGAFVIGGACIALLGPLPGDLTVTLALQAAFHRSPQWAEILTDTAKPPLVVATIAVGAGLAYLVAGWRGALSVTLSFSVGWLIDKALRAIIYMPRPSSALVDVASASSSSGLPSTFGLVYGTIFGVSMFAATNSKFSLAIRALAIALIIAGASARVVLGGHWASQMLVSILLGLAAASGALAMTDYIRRRRRATIR
jgi:membrane-associated phospholipid phosphatase